MKYCAALLLFAAIGSAQELPRFAVASIKAADRNSGQGSFWQISPAGDVRIHDVPMLTLIEAAYGVPDFQVTGYPAWVTSEYFDVEAKTGEKVPLTAAAMQARFQALLAERCGLTVERTTREAMAFVLTVDSRGAKMRAADAAPEKTIRRPFGLHSEGMTMAQLARTLSTVVRAPVTDETGLAGAYAFDLRYSESPEVPGGAARAPSDDPEVFRALKEQLGLTLVKRKTTVDTVVVTHVERPSAN